jgi:catechol 2,3-dioxygenase-like lactoylglutathione lyase family enzyme
MSADINYLHHVGHVVTDMEEGLALYRRLGFVLLPPSYPMLSPHAGAPPRPVGAANTHASFARNFIELMTCLQEGSNSHIPSDAHLVPLHAPAEHLPRIAEAINRTTATLAACLARFQGLHILVFQTDDPDGVAARLSAEGVRHGGVNTIKRPVETSKGMQMEPIRVIEIEDPDAATVERGRVAEGRIAVAANPSAESLLDPRFLEHPNGAVDLVESILCVARAELPAFERRYQQYLGRSARTEGGTRVLDLKDSRITLVADSELEAILPGERAPAVPAFVAYAVAVRDIGATEKLLQQNGFPLKKSAAGDLFVPAAAALGAAVLFRPAARSV